VTDEHEYETAAGIVTDGHGHEHEHGNETAAGMATDEHGVRERVHVDVNVRHESQPWCLT
jgi:hypothetical protein